MKDWNNYHLGDLLLFISKGTTPPKGAGFVDEGINYIKSESISYNRKIDKSKFCFITPELHNKYKRSQLQEDDILFSMAGVFLGKNAVVKKNMLPANTNQALAILRVKRKLVLPDFLSYYLSQPRIIEYVNNMSGQSAQPNVNFEEIKSIPISIPELSEQHAVLNVLNTLDGKIDLLRRQNATLEAMAEALFKQWFVVEAKDGWEEFALKDIAYQIKNSISPQNYPQEKFYHYSIPAYDLNKIPEVVCGQSVLSNKFLVEKNCVLISKLNPQFPRVWMLMDDIQKNSISSTEFISVNPYNKQELSFIYCLFKNNNVSSELARSASGTSGSHQRIKPEDIFSVTFSAPNRQYLTEFSNQVLPMFEHIHMNQTQIRTLEKLRDTLLPKLMSGEVRVSLD